MKCPECSGFVIYAPNGYYCGHCDWEESLDGDEDDVDEDALEDNIDDHDWEPGGDDDE